MKWIKERDALIAQTMAFVQSVTGRKDDLHPPASSSAAFAAAVEIAPVERGAVETGWPAAISPSPPELKAGPFQVPPRTGTDFRAEMQARIANFRKHQERFAREREEYCAATLTKVRAAIRNPSLQPRAEE